ncbi:hypothetical protein [Roseibium sp.]|uniref:hypothetical protein n=1 Tax=Roseibium sp. TaxID=1936156 RepID=UPI003B5113BB
MSVTSLLVKTALNQSYNDLANRDANRSQASDRGETLLHTFVNASRILSEEDQEAARALVDEFKEAVSISSTLKKATKSHSDNSRSERLERVSQRIEQLKMMIRFASPEQAKKLLKQLKQLSGELKAAGADRKGMTTGSITGAGARSTLDTAVEATNMALQTTLGVATQQTRATATSTQVSAAGNLVYATPVVSGSQTTGTNLSTGSPKGAGTGENSTNATDQRSAYFAEIAAYTEQQHETDRIEANHRQKGFKAEAKVIWKLADELKKLEEEIKKLLEQNDDDDDDTARRDLKAIERNLRETDVYLNQTELLIGLATNGARTPSVSATTEGAPISGFATSAVVAPVTTPSFNSIA